MTHYTPIEPWCWYSGISLAIASVIVISHIMFPPRRNRADRLTEPFIRVCRDCRREILPDESTGDVLTVENLPAALVSPAQCADCEKVARMEMKRFFENNTTDNI